jgi:hypothetical protein
MLKVKRKRNLRRRSQRRRANRRRRIRSQRKTKKIRRRRIRKRKRRTVMTRSLMMNDTSSFNSFFILTKLNYNIKLVLLKVAYSTHILG